VTGIDIRNSADTSKGDPNRVVGYGSFIFEPADDAHTPEVFAKVLLQLAQQVVIKGAELNDKPKIELKNIPRSLFTYRSCFTTIEIDHQLRGCYGSFTPAKPLIADVVDQSYNAAFKDPRFKPMTMKDVEVADISLSLLSIPCLFPIEDEQDLISKITPEKDGLILRSKGKSGLFLPSVWDSLPEPEEFVKGLKRKAGFKEDYWSDDIQIFRYTAEKIGPVPIIKH
jgi:AmmeMemoRadiSam system protein A